MSINPEITERIPGALQYLERRGFVVGGHQFSSSDFGNFYVVLSDGKLTIRIINDRSQLFGEIWSPGGEWEWIESYLKKRGAPVDELEANHHYDENRLLDLLQHLIESEAA
jgi:hypothetical protein